MKKLTLIALAAFSTVAFAQEAARSGGGGGGGSSSGGAGGRGWVTIEWIGGAA